MSYPNKFFKKLNSAGSLSCTKAMENLTISNVQEKQDISIEEIGATKLLVGQLKTANKNRQKQERFSGESIEMSQILYLQDYNAKPSLIYLKHQIGTIENSQPDKNILTVTSLHDSGCAKSIAKRSLIQKLEQYTGEKINIVPDKTYKCGNLQQKIQEKEQEEARYCFSGQNEDSQPW